MLRVKTISLAALLCALVPGLFSCGLPHSVIDKFGPQPNEVLLQLARDAEADAENKLSQDAEKLRIEQADQLYEEISRICGTDEQGQTPRSCGVDRGAGAPSEQDATNEGDAQKRLSTLTSSRQEILDALPQAPEESHALLVQQAIELAGISFDRKVYEKVPRLDETSDTADIESAKKLLDWSYASLYSLDIAEAFASGRSLRSIKEDIAFHEERVVLLSTALEKTGDIPAPAASYQPINAPFPANGKQAAGFASSMRKSDYKLLIDAAHSAIDPAWRAWLVEATGVR